MHTGGRLKLVAVGATALLAVAACSGGDGKSADSTSKGQSSSGSGNSGNGSSSADSKTPYNITISAAGDVLVHVPVRNDAAKFGAQDGKKYDFAPMFADVKPLLSKADVAICHIETPLSQTDTNLSRPGVLVFNNPREVIDGVKSAGYDGCDFASNHSWDLGLNGLKSTKNVITDAGLQYAGPNPDPNQPEHTGWYTVRGTKIAHIAYTYTMLNNWGPNTTTAPGYSWFGGAMWPVQGAAGIIKAAQQAKAQGAQIVVVSLHWGAEYNSMPTADQTKLAKELLSSPDVDLILGTHVHVVQPCATINGKYVFYGMGNSLSNQSPAAGLRPETQEGITVTVTLTRDANGKVAQKAVYQPTRVDMNGHIIKPATKTGNPTTWNRMVHWVSALGEGACQATPTP